VPRQSAGVGSSCPAAIGTWKASTPTNAMITAAMRNGEVGTQALVRRTGRSAR